jgi:hypothetical protein
MGVFFLLPIVIVNCYLDESGSPGAKDLPGPI